MTTTIRDQVESGALIDMQERARRKERIVQLLLAPGIAAVAGGLVTLRVLAVERLSLGRGNA